MRKLISLIFFLGVTACDPFDSGRFFSLIVTAHDPSNMRGVVEVKIKKEDWNYSKSQDLYFDSIGYGKIVLSDTQAPIGDFYVDVEIEGEIKNVFISKDANSASVNFELNELPLNIQ